MDSLSLLIFALALSLNSGTPGPSIAALVSRVLARGPGDVVPFLAAMWLGELLWLVAALVGLTQLAHSFQTGFAVLKYLGVAYLLWLAWKMWHQPVQTDGGLPRTRSPLAMFASGMALTLGNPKIMVFYLALLPTFFDLGALSMADGALICAVMVIVLMVVDLGYVMLAASARHVLRSPRAVRLTNRIGATVLGGAAVTIATR